MSRGESRCNFTVLTAEAFVPSSGALVAGRYQLRRVIGSGGMGQVWEAYDLQLESSCAIKFILDHMAGDAGVRSRFAREAKAVAGLRTPHAVQILGIGEHADALYIAMELLEGETLRSRLSRVGRLDESTTLAILQQVAQALEKARLAGIVHRDLKPENIWLWAGNDVFAKILDFGVAKSLMPGNSLQTATGALLGTPYYMSPEQARGNHDVDHRTDLWALSIIAIECLGGRRPFESEGLGDLLVKILTLPPPPLDEVAPHLPVGLTAWWEKALARKPEQRFQTATELVDSLRTSLHPTPYLARSAQSFGSSSGRVGTYALPAVAGSVSPVSGQHAPRPRMRRVGLALGALALVGGGITAWRLSTRQEVATAHPAARELGAPSAAATQPASDAPGASPATPGSNAAEAPVHEAGTSEASVKVRPITEPGDTREVPSAATGTPALNGYDDEDTIVRDPLPAKLRNVEPERNVRGRTERRVEVRAVPKPTAVRETAKPAPAAERPAPPSTDYGF